MRIFYIFNINQEFSTLTKECPYNLYKTMEQIYRLNKNDFSMAMNLFETLAIPFDKNELNIKIFKKYRNNQNYTKFNNVHMLNNYYTDEQTELTVKNALLILKSTIQNPSFLKDLRETNGLFVCDFENKDYFWLNQILV